MPSRHSKNSSDATHFRYHEKVQAGVGSITQRLGTDSQQPFGHCCLCLAPVEDAVISPSGHMYEREVILEYLLKKTKELKKQAKMYAQQQEQAVEDERHRQEAAGEAVVNKFVETVEGVENVVKRKASELEAKNSYFESRKRVIDDTSRDEKQQALRQVAPWLPSFTPEAAATAIKAPPKRPPSPMTGRPLKVADLTPVNMTRESDSKASAVGESVKFICPVSRKTITSQKVVAIKKTNQIMLESVAKELAYPTMTCPVTGKKFQMSDVVQVAQVASGFASTGKVEAKKYRPSMN